MNAYYILLHAHSGLRWIALLLAIVVTLKSLIGLFSGGKYTKFDKITSISYVISMDLMLTLGIALYFASPITNRFTFNMSDPLERFWSVEHALLMFVAVAAAHIGRSIRKKSPDDVVKFRFGSIFYGMSLVFMLLGIPWSRL